MVRSSITASTATNLAAHADPTEKASSQLTSVIFAAAREFGVAAAVFFACGVVLFWPAWVHGLGAYAEVGGLADISQQSFFLALPSHIGTFFKNPLLTNVANFPFGISLAANATMLALGILSIPSQLLLGPLASFNLLLTLAPALSALSLYGVLRSVVQSKLARLLGGAIFGFGPYEVAQSTAGHLPLTFLALVPIFFWLQYQIVVVRKFQAITAGFLLGVVIVIQYFVSPEILVDTLVIGAVSGMLMLVSQGTYSRNVAYLVASLGIAALVSFALLAYPTWYFIHGPQHYLGQSQPNSSAFSSDLLSIALPTKLVRFGLAAWKVRSTNYVIGDLSENGGYLGFIALGFTVLAISVSRSNRLKIAGVTSVGAFAWLLSLGPSLVVNGTRSHVALPYALFERIPLLSNALPVRYTLFVDLALAVVIALAVGELRSQRWMRVGVLLAAMTVVASLLPASGNSMTPVTIPRFFVGYGVAGSGARTVEPVLAVYPWPTYPHTLAMLWQAEANFKFKLVGAYALGPGANGLVTMSLGDGPLAQIFNDAYGGISDINDAKLIVAARATIRADRITDVVVAQSQPNSSLADSAVGVLVQSRPVCNGGVCEWHLLP